MVDIENTYIIMRQLLGILLCMMLALPQQSFAQQPSPTSKKTRDMKMYGRVVDSVTNLAISDSKITLMTLDSTAVDTCSTQAWNKNLNRSAMVIHSVQH